METCKTEAVTKEAAEKAKKLLQRYERQEKAKKKGKARTVCLLRGRVQVPQGSERRK
jgi:hypothetical protein